MVVDTSVILAIVFQEEHAPWSITQLERYRDTLCMSTVNLTEALIRMKDRQPTLASKLETTLLDGPIRFVPPSTEQARIAAEARLRYPLNLGDCFAYALARAEDDRILTLDKDFRNLDLEVLLPG